eukprot:2773700-Pyramimonas_sp.AAC.1
MAAVLRDCICVLRHPLQLLSPEVVGARQERLAHELMHALLSSGASALSFQAPCVHVHLHVSVRCQGRRLHRCQHSDRRSHLEVN